MPIASNYQFASMTWQASSCQVVGHLPCLVFSVASLMAGHAHPGTEILMASPCRGRPLIKSVLVACPSQVVLFFQSGSEAPATKLFQFHPVRLLSQTLKLMLQDCEAKAVQLELQNQHRVSWRSVMFLRYPSSGQSQQKSELRFAVSIASSRRVAKHTRLSFHPLPGAKHCSSIIARQTTEAPDVCDVPSVLPRAGFRCLPALGKRPGLHPALPLFAPNIIPLHMQQR